MIKKRNTEEETMSSKSKTATNCDCHLKANGLPNGMVWRDGQRCGCEECGGSGIKLRYLPAPADSDRGGEAAARGRAMLCGSVTS